MNRLMFLNIENKSLELSLLGINMLKIKLGIESLNVNSLRVS